MATTRDNENDGIKTEDVDPLASARPCASFNGRLNLSDFNFQSPAQNIVSARSPTKDKATKSEQTSPVKDGVRNGFSTSSTGLTPRFDATAITISESPPSRAASRAAKSKPPQHDAEPELREAFPSVQSPLIKAVLVASGGRVIPAYNALKGLTGEQDEKPPLQPVEVPADATRNLFRTKGRLPVSRLASDAARSDGPTNGNDKSREISTAQVVKKDVEIPGDELLPSADAASDFLVQVDEKIAANQDSSGAIQAGFLSFMPAGGAQTSTETASPGPVFPLVNPSPTIFVDTERLKARHIPSHTEDREAYAAQTDKIGVIIARAASEERTESERRERECRERGRCPDCGVQCGYDSDGDQDRSRKCTGVDNDPKLEPETMFARVKRRAAKKATNYRVTWPDVGDDEDDNRWDLPMTRAMARKDKKRNRRVGEDDEDEWNSLNGFIVDHDVATSLSASATTSSSATPPPDPASAVRKRKLVTLSAISTTTTTSTPKKKPKTPTGYAPPSTYAHLPELTDVTGENLIGIFIGLNPGLKTAAVGHAYAHPSNTFWKLLFSSGLTPDHKLKPQEDRTLPEKYQLGNTNIVARPTRNGSELTKAEMDGAVFELEDKIRKWRPEVAIVVGKSVWESIFRVKMGTGIRKGEFKYGWQDFNIGVVDRYNHGYYSGVGSWEGAKIFVATSTSGLAATPKYKEKEVMWRELGDWVQERRRERKAEAEAEAKKISVQSATTTSASEEFVVLEKDDVIMTDSTFGTSTTNTTTITEVGAKAAWNAQLPSIASVGHLDESKKLERKLDDLAETEDF